MTAERAETSIMGFEQTTGEGIRGTGWEQGSGWVRSSDLAAATSITARPMPNDTANQPARRRLTDMGKYSMRHKLQGARAICKV